MAVRSRNPSAIDGGFRAFSTSWEVLKSRFYSLVLDLRERVDSFLVLKQVNESIPSRLRRALEDHAEVEVAFISAFRGC